MTELIFEGDTFLQAATAVKEQAEKLRNKEVEWIIFFKEIYGVDGILSKLPVPWKHAILKSDLGKDLQVMMRELRQQILDAYPSENSKSFTIRVPEPLFDALNAEAVARKVSPNKLWMTKLLQHVDDDLIPEEFIAEQET